MSFKFAALAKWLVILAFHSLVTTSFAQKVSFGIKAGLNLSKVSDVLDPNSNGEVKNNFAPHAGIYFNIGKGKLTFQPEVLFSIKGFKSHSELFSITSDTKFSISYIEVPLQLRLSPTPGFGFLAGPYVGFMLDANATTEVTVGTVSNVSEDVNKDKISNIDYGFNAGALIQTEGGIFFGGKYVYGLSDVFDKSGSGNDNIENEEGNNRNGVIQVFVGVQF